MIDFEISGFHKNSFQNKSRLQLRIVNSWNNQITRRQKRKDVDEDKDGENVPKLESVEKSTYFQNNFFFQIKRDINYTSKATQRLLYDQKKKKEAL